MPEEQVDLHVRHDRNHVFITIEGQEYRLSGYLARYIGDGLYKAGCAVQNNEEDKK